MLKNIAIFVLLQSTLEVFRTQKMKLARSLFLTILIAILKDSEGKKVIFRLLQSIRICNYHWHYTGNAQRNGNAL